tara:strand:- start:49 stop:450 length:402 start_codon:yes stop_codon:yes gene_type:complete
VKNNKMSNNYKVVNVYINYNENSIGKIDIIKSEFGVDDVVKGVWIDLDIKFKDDDDLYYGIYSIDEKKDIGVIGYGDESIILVLGEKNDWYNKVDEFNVSSDIEKEVDFSNGLYDEEDWENWVELIESVCEKK